MGACKREVFDRPEDVVLGLANAVVLLSKVIAEKDIAALGTMTKIHDRLAVILDDINASPIDSAWIDKLMTETKIMVSALSIRH